MIIVYYFTFFRRGSGAFAAPKRFGMIQFNIKYPKHEYLFGISPHIELTLQKKTEVKKQETKRETSYSLSWDFADVGRRVHTIVYIWCRCQVSSYHYNYVGSNSY